MPVAAPRHTADEEVSLFPRLRDTSDPAAAQGLDRLERDHHEATEHHAAVDVLVRRWLADNGLVLSQAAELRERLAR